MSSFCTAKATHIFFSKKFQHICISLDVNFNESLTNDIVSFEQLGPVCQIIAGVSVLFVLRFYGPINPMGVMSSTVFTQPHFYWSGLVL